MFRRQEHIRVEAGSDSAEHASFERASAASESRYFFWRPVKTSSRPSSARAACPSATSRARRTADRRGGTADRGVAGRICLISTTTRTARRCYNQISGSERPRGGAWNNQSINLRAANRNNNTPDNHNQNVGFRLATHPACPARCRAVAVRGAGRLRQHKKGASSGPGRGLGPGQRTPRRARASRGRPPCLPGASGRGAPLPVGGRRA